jgi:hypothetical protein
LILNEIITELLKKRRDYYVNSKIPPKNEPKFVIYIGIDLYYDLQNEYKEGTPHNIGKKGYIDDIYGFPVYVVLDKHNYWKIYREE